MTKSGNGHMPGHRLPAENSSNESRGLRGPTEYVGHGSACGPHKRWGDNKWRDQREDEAAPSKMKNLHHSTPTLPPSITLVRHWGSSSSSTTRRRRWRKVEEHWECGRPQQPMPSSSLHLSRHLLPVLFFTFPFPDASPQVRFCEVDFGFLYLDSYLGRLDWSCWEDAILCCFVQF